MYHLRYPMIILLILTSEFGQGYALKKHFQMFEDPYFSPFIWKISELNRNAPFCYIWWPIFWTSENSQVQPQSNIFKISNNPFLQGTFKNGLNSVSEYHFEMFENLFYVWTTENSQTLALDIILRCLRTHYFIQIFENSYCLSTDHIFKIYNDLFIQLNVWE